MAEAGPSSASMASAPIHYVAAAHHSQQAVFLSANVVQLSYIKSGKQSGIDTQFIPTLVNVPQSLKPDQSDAARYAQNPHIGFARIAEFSQSDRFLALTGDDKVLRVWKLETASDGTVHGFGLGKEVLIKHLPKRGAMLHWMRISDDSTAPEELIVVDRFGDVRSFLLDPAINVGAAVVAATPRTADEQDEMDSPSDSSMQILLGHVGMITSMAFVPNYDDPRAPPPLVITGDRDEHIRVSRWGSQRAAYVIERFLQGSRSFVGALAVVANRDEPPQLLSSEGGENLRVWSLSSLDSSQEACMSICAVGAALAPYVLVREREERKRESKSLKAFSKKSLKRSKQGDDTPLESRSRACQYSRDSKPTTVITKCVPFIGDDAEPQLLIVVEGASAFFHLPLAVVLDTSTSPHDISRFVKVTETKIPILSLLLRTDPDTKAVTVWTSLDTRKEFCAESESSVSEPKEACVFQYTQGRFEPIASPLTDSIRPASSDESASRALLDESIVDGLSLYPALTTWPKIETPSSAEIIATRSTRKGRFNHPLDTSLIGVHPVAGVDRVNGKGGADDDEQRQKLVKSMQGGKRERGRERNREAIRQAQEASQPST